MSDDNEIYELSIATVWRNVYGLGFVVIISVLLVLYGLPWLILIPIFTVSAFLSYWDLRNSGDIEADKKEIRVFTPIKSYAISWENIRSIDLDIGGKRWIVKGKEGQKILMPGSLLIKSPEQYPSYPHLDAQKKLLGEFIYKQCEQYQIPLGGAIPYASYLGANN